MKSLHVRNLDNAALDGLKRRAARHRRSLQREVECLLSDAAHMLPPESTTDNPPRLKLHKVASGRPAQDWSRETIYDANIVATMQANGLSCIRTNNPRDFDTFEGIEAKALL